MTIIPLYRYTRPDGGITVSPVQPVGIEYEILSRLVADEGKILTDGNIYTYCIDTENEEDWIEVDDVEQVD